MKRAGQTSRPCLCHIIHEDGPGGGPKSVINLLNYFHDKFDLIVFRGRRGRIAAKCDELGVRHIEMPLHKLGPAVLLIPLLAIRLRKIAPDILLLHGQWAGVIGALAARLASIRKVIYVAQWPAFYTDWDLFRVMRNRMVESISCRLVAQVVLISRGNYYQYLIRRLIDEKRTRVIPNSINLDDIPLPETAAKYRAELGWNDGRCHVVSVGRLADQKRIDWLLRSWKIVAESGEAAHLWIIGDGPDRASLEQLARELDITGSCSFVGAQNGLQYIAACDIVAMTSLYEGHANVPLEAMACGKPIVANEVDGTRQSLTEAVEGYLVTPGNTELFAQRLLQLIRDPAARAQMGLSGTETVRKFATDAVMAEYDSLMRELLASHSDLPEPA
ncbi:MAG: glycosyltransferase [Verrucomicrobia bacterium]|nr:glycosyltransferase [Verrucomicrobiota bacterium]